MAEAVVVVGLVLGALPLVISALEHYRDGLDPVIDFWRYDATLRDLQIQLRIEQDLYQGTLKRLLLSELSQQQLEALFPDPGEPQRIALWETNEVNQKLRFKLGKRYDIFMDAVQVMDTTIKKLMEKLDIDAQGKPKWTSVPESRSRIGWEWRRIRRSFGRREREALINKFGQYNAKVAAWVQNNEILAPPSEARVESSTAYFHSVRDHASRLYSILEHGWSCNCIDPHNVHLQLDQRNVTQDPPSFQVCFSHYPQSSGGGQSQWLWQKTQIHLEEMKEGLLATSSSAHTASVRLDHTVSTPITPSGELERTSQINPARLPSKSKVRKAVRFQGTSPMFAPIPHTAQSE
ncbi:MAG: hypothetical protein M1813_008020 [Trichoglossum hirsutum]|nr:MAG: hypothetical protein M1813_008020 [Trichoglossum hirsutum]